MSARSMRFRFALLALLAAAVWSCQDRTGPNGVIGHFALVPSFSSSSAGIVDIGSVRVRLIRADESVALDTTVTVVPGSDSLSLELSVVVLSAEEVFQLFLDFVTPEGDVAYQAGPVEVQAGTGTTGDPVPVPVDPVYVGVGANAASVEIVTVGEEVFFGDTVKLDAVARDAGGTAIPGTPVAWSSLDLTRATVPDEAVGNVVGGTTRGSVVIQATLLTGQSDTASVVVQPVPSFMVLTGGDGQSGLVDSELPVPVTVVVSAADELPVQGVPVLFQTADGGTFSVDSADTDAAGQVQTMWTLGPGVGGQSATATAAGFPSVQVSIAATAVSPNIITWTNALGGNWSDAGNWDLGRAPLASDTVNIDLAGDYTVTLDVNATVGALNLGGFSGIQILDIPFNTLTLGGDATVGTTGRLALSGGTLDGTGNLDVSGSLALSGGSLSGAGIATVQGGFDWTGGAMSGTGQTVLGASSLANLSGGIRTLDGRTLTNQGTLTWTAGAINALNGAAIQNEAGATFDMQGDESLNWIAGAQPTLANAGTLRRSVGVGAAGLNAILSGAGSLEVLSGTLNLGGGGTYSGTMTVATGATLQFSGGTITLDAASSLTGDGSIDFTGGTTTVLGVFDNISLSTTTIAGGVVNFDNTTTPATVTSLVLSSGTLGGAGDVSISGSLDWTGGTMAGTGNTVLDPGSVASLAGGIKVIDTRGLNNQGSLTWTAGAINGLNGAAIQNASGAAFDIQADAALNWIAGTQPTLDNAGSFTRTVGAGVASIGAVVSGSGSLDVQSGVLALGGGGTYGGAVGVASGASLQFTGGTMTLDAASSVSSDGSIDFASGAVTVLGTYVVNGPATSITGGTVNFENTTTPAATTVLVMSSGALGGAGDVLTGALTWSGGTMSGAGQTVVQTSAVLDGGVKSLDTRTLVNQGALAWIAGGINGLNAAMIQNEAAAAFNIQADAALSWIAGAQPALVNDGSVTRSIGTGVASIGAALGGAGSLDVLTGTLALGGGGTYSGAMDVATGATLQFSGGTMALDASSIVTGDGTVEFSGGTVTVLGTFDNTSISSVRVTGGAVDFDNTGSPATMAGLVLSAGTMGGAGDVNVSGALDWTGGTMAGAGQTVLGASSSATLGGGVKNLDTRSLINQGSGVWTAGGINGLNAASIRNAPGATFDIQADAALSWIAGGQPDLTNDGTLVRSTGTGTVSVGFTFLNNGTLDVQTGTLALSAAYADASLATLQGAGTLDVPGDFAAQGTVNMTGTLQVSGVLNPTGSYAVGTTVFTGATQTIPATLSYQNIGVTGFSVSFPGASVTVTGDVLVDGGTLNVGLADIIDVLGKTTIINNGELYVGAGGSLTVTGDFATTTGGHFSMTSGTDILTVKGNVDIQGGSTAGLLTAGTMYVGGSFNQGPAGDPASYAPTGTFRTVFDGAGLNTASFANPGPAPAASQFQDLELAHNNSTDALNFTTDVYVAGVVYVYSIPPAGATSDPATTITVAGSGVDNGGGEGGSWDVEHTLLSGSTTTWANPMKNVTVTGSALASFVTVTGNLTIAGTGDLNLNSSWVFVQGNFATQDNATLTMVGTSDQLTVDGSITFGGGSTDGLLTDGIIIANGDFLQTSGTSAESFRAGLAHTVRMAGSLSQDVSFASPGIDAGGSRFANVDFRNTVGARLLSDVYVHADFISPLGAAPAIIVGSGNRLVVGALNVAGLQLDRVLLEWRGTTSYTGLFAQFTNVDFTNYNAADVQFYILHPGAAATTYFMGPLTFDTKPTMGVGYYVKAEDSDAAAPVLQVDLGFFFIGTDIPDPTPDLFDDFFQEVNGAQLFYSYS